MKRLTYFAFGAACVGFVAGQDTWCGKFYMEGSSPVNPGGQFPSPATSTQELLAFRCAPAIKPYLEGELSGSFIIDTGLTHTEVAGAAPFTSNSKADLEVTVSVGGHVVASGPVPLNANGHELPFSLLTLKAQKEAFNVSCTAETGGQTFHATNVMSYMPRPTSGSVTKLNLLTGALLVESGLSWEPIFPIGFYTSFDGYLATNLSLLNELKAQGFTIVHPVPTFDNLTAFNLVLDRMEEVGLYLMYDMRFTYQNSTSVTEQVNMIKSRKNLLLWYTGDEPDGTSDPLNATKIAYDLIYELDGYHPVSLVLNCQDYYFTEYIQGTDIVMEDVYPIDINATFSSEWHTPCTPELGDCGCDNCEGDLGDISTRLDEFKQRLEILGDTRNKAVWGVPQAFGGEEYWPRPPTGQEFLVESVLSINHGALGIVPWDDPTPTDIKDSASSLAKALPSINEFLASAIVLFSGITSDDVDVGIWTLGPKTLLLATNLNYASANISVTGVPTKGVKATEILNSGGSLTLNAHGARISLESVGTVGYILVE